VNIWQIKKIARPSKQDQKHISLIYKETKEGQPYLTITKSRFMGEGKDRKRASIIVLRNFNDKRISDGALTLCSISL
jgi:hypothetical protein